MPDENKDTISQFKTRAKLPKIFGGAAIVVFAAAVCVVVVSFFLTRSNPEFRMKGFPTSLSEDVVATVNGYERREMDGELTRYLIRADKATSFSDNHQELENVFLQVFSEDGSTSDQISAQKAVYIPAENKNFTAYFAGKVNIDTRDALNVKTEQLTYTRADEIAKAEELVEFKRSDVRGRSIGATVHVKEKVLELLKDVEIHSGGEAEAERSTLTSGYATYDQAAEKIDLSNGIAAEMTSSGDAGKPAGHSSLSADRAVAFLAEGSVESKPINRVELFGSVNIERSEGDSAPTKISSQYALYQKPIERFDLRGAVYILTAEDGRPTEARAENAVYQQPQGMIDLTGNASVTQTSSLVQGHSIHAELDAAKKVKLAEVSTNGLVRQTTPERTTEAAGPKLIAAFGDGQELVDVRVLGAGSASLIPANAAGYTKLTMTAARSIDVDFKGEGLLDKIVTAGRTNIKMDVPNNSPNAANKSVTADSVTSTFSANGKDLANAIAVGNAQLVISPLNPSENTYQTSVYAPRFDCDFFAAGSDPKTCVAAAKTKTVRVPSKPTANRGTQNITSEKLVANFDPQSRELASLEAVGDAKFTERDRNGTSERIIYTSADETVRLRGGGPNVWDSKARAKAPEIDWNTKLDVSELRGGASTTYYNSSGTGGAAPFEKSEKPIYITADNARFDHRAEVAVYTGNARGWQDKNYVRSHRMTISEKDGRFVAEENVQSLLYEAKRRDNGVETNQPVFVAAQKLTYTRDDRHLRYENNVDIRQGKERITGGLADIFLNENSDPAKTEVRQNVVITQPKRRAAADYARYEAATEVVFLQGDPATVEDAEQGRTRASEITVNLKEDRYIGIGPSKQNSAGRTRSVYKPKDQ
ncbi:MAG: LPS export ABC transporter periplasmic protein LptC [Pyrinomonadaceae bacterium]